MQKNIFLKNIGKKKNGEKNEKIKWKRHAQKKRRRKKKK